MAPTRPSTALAAPLVRENIFVFGEESERIFVWGGNSELVVEVARARK